MTLVMLPSGTGKFGYFVFRGLILWILLKINIRMFLEPERVLLMLFMSLLEHMRIFFNYKILSNLIILKVLLNQLNHSTNHITLNFTYPHNIFQNVENSFIRNTLWLTIIHYTENGSDVKSKVSKLIYDFWHFLH